MPGEPCRASHTSRREFLNFLNFLNVLYFLPFLFFFILERGANFLLRNDSFAHDLPIVAIEFHDR